MTFFLSQIYKIYIVFARNQPLIYLDLTKRRATVSRNAKTSCSPKSIFSCCHLDTLAGTSTILEIVSVICTVSTCELSRRTIPHNDIPDTANSSHSSIAASLTCWDIKNRLTTIPPDPSQAKNPLSQKKRSQISLTPLSCTPAGVRTLDTLIKSQVLYQLSYGCNFSNADAKVHTFI